MTLSVFPESFNADNQVGFQLKYHHKGIDGSVLWASLGTTIESPETWRRLLKYKSEVVEIGVFIVDNSMNRPLEIDGKPVGINFHVSSTAQGNNWDMRQALAAAPKSYTVCVYPLNISHELILYSRIASLKPIG